MKVYVLRGINQFALEEVKEPYFAQIEKNIIEFINSFFEKAEKILDT